MNGDTVEVMKALTEVQTALQESIAGLGKDISELKGEMKARVSSIEKEQQKISNRQWIHSSVVLPVSLVIRAVLTHLGIKL